MKKRITDDELSRAGDIVAIRPCCNRIVFAAVNHPAVIDAQAKRTIGQLAADGCKIEHWTTEQVRKGEFGCKCNKLERGPAANEPALL